MFLRRPQGWIAVSRRICSASNFRAFSEMQGTLHSGLTTYESALCRFTFWLSAPALVKGCGQQSVAPPRCFIQSQVTQCPRQSQWLIQSPPYSPTIKFYLSDRHCLWPSFAPRKLVSVAFSSREPETNSHQLPFVWAALLHHDCGRIS